MASLKIYKIGGGIIDNETELQNFLRDLSQVEGLKILVHGGGKGASKTLEKLGIEPKMVNGRRITDAPTLEVVTSLYAGTLNKHIVATLQKNKVNAIGLSGADGNAINGHKRAVKEIDYGWVGDLNQESINAELYQLLLENNYTPVNCAIIHNGNGQLLNTNADTIASAIAQKLSKFYEVELHFCFDKIGVLKDIEDENSLISEINQEKYAELKAQNIVSDGMIPKLDNAFDVIKSGVKSVYLEHPKNLNSSIKTKIF